MEANGTSTAANAPPRATHTTTQPSIRSFFQVRAPGYAAPPSTSKSPSPAPNHATASSPSATASPPKDANDNSSPSLPLRASIALIQEQHIQPLRRINSLLLPIAYPDSFYHKILSPDNFSRVVLWTETNPPTSSPTVIGGIVCRLEPSPTDPTVNEIYVQSLALLSPYRSQGLATSLLNTVISAAVSQSPSGNKIESLYAHVWTENVEALEWYVARGFKKEEPVIHGYYRRLKPDTAWILRRLLSPSDYLQHVSSPSPQLPSQPPTLPPPQTSTPLNGTALPRHIRPKLGHSNSFQDRRPDREWNDLPSDLELGRPKAPSASTSRSPSMSRSAGGKKKRQYPAAAFGA